MHMVSIFHWKGVLQFLAKVLMLWWLAKSLCAVCHALLSQCHKAKGHVHPSFSPAPCWPRGSPGFPELRVLSWWGQCGDRCWQCPSVRAGRAKSGHLWALRWSLPGHGDLGGPPDPERREYWASLEGGDHDHLILSVITFPLPLGVQPWGLVYPAFLHKQQWVTSLLFTLSLPCLPTLCGVVKVRALKLTKGNVVFDFSEI